MRSRRLGALGLAVGVALAGCGERQPQVPSEPEFSHTASATCDFNGLNSLIPQYFDQALQPTAQTLKQQMEAAHAASSEADVQARGFDILALIEAAVNGSTAGPAATGSTLAHELLECMFIESDLPNPFPDNLFVEELTLASAGGLGAFGVRGGGVGPATTAVLAGDGFSGVAPPNLSSWSAILPERILIYGQRASTTQLSYAWFKIRPTPPGPNFNPPGLVVGLCGSTSSIDMVQHNDLGILAFVDPDYFLSCSAFVSGILEPSSRGLFAFARRLVELVAPRSLHAVAHLGGKGGQTPSISHFDFEAINQVVLEFLVEPLNPVANVAVNPPVEVRALGDGNPMAGVQITLSAFPISNKGKRAGVSGHIAVTGSDGIAEFPNLRFSKAGVYSLKAEGVVQGVPAITNIVPDITASFTVSGPSN